jgi:hypothetical protein
MAMDTRRTAFSLDDAQVPGLQVGDGNVQHNHFAAVAEIVRSGYPELVRRHVPDELQDREHELADLATFCTGDTVQRYLGFTAPAWAGKTALLSWFVLHPPPGVTVVSFFVTGRHYSQNNRHAYVDSVLEQLAELLQERTYPATLPESTKDAHLARKLAAAATACLEAGRRLVLVVDGLDEDRGVTVDGASYSIAAALPHRVPPGLAVVVSRRSGFPLPPDVPSNHPLRERCLMRDLGQSAHATVARDDILRELKNILTTGGRPARLLGLITAAGGGLTADDLADLLDEERWRVEDALGSVAGRMYIQVDDAFALAHEDLPAVAEQLLGARILDEHRQRLHDWADGYADRGWPEEVPGYLLHGYARMLATQRDTARLVRHAGNRERHRRLLERTRSDAAALEEVTLAQDALLDRGEPDLPAMCGLALLRVELEGRGAALPSDLPALWAAVGEVDRAKALADSIPDDGSARNVARARLVPEVAAAGHLDLAEELLASVPDLSFWGEDTPGMTAGTVAQHIARTGDLDRALRLADQIDDSPLRSRARVMAILACPPADEGGVEAAEALALQVPTLFWRAQAFAHLAAREAERGHLGEAVRLAEMAQSQADSIPEPVDRSFVYAILAKRIASWGTPAEARRLADLAADVAASIADTQQRASRLTGIIHRLSGVADLAMLESLAESAETGLNEILDDPHSSPETKSRLARSVMASWYTAGRRDRAERLGAIVLRSENIPLPPYGEAGRRHLDAWTEERLVIQIIAAAAEGGDLSHALALTESLSSSNGRDHALRTIVACLPDEHDEACLTGLVDGIEHRFTKAAAVTDWAYRALRRNDIGRAKQLAERAETITRSGRSDSVEVELLTSLAIAFVESGDSARARKVARRALQICVSDEGGTPRRPAPQPLAEAAAEAGDHDTAAAAARLIEDPEDRAQAQIALSCRVHRRGDQKAARTLLDEGLTSSIEVTAPGKSLKLRQAAITAHWIIGEDAAAERLLHRHDTVSLAETAHDSYGAPVTLFPPTKPSVERVRNASLADAVKAVAAAGHSVRAEALSRLISEQSLIATSRLSIVLAMSGLDPSDSMVRTTSLMGLTKFRHWQYQTASPLLSNPAEISLAHSIATSIDRDYERTKALFVLARRTEPSASVPIVMQLVRQGHLADALDLIARAQPSTLDLIADHLLGDDRD